MMARPEDCFAVSMPWNPASADAAGYRSLYLSLFGKDLAAGETAKAHCRLLLGRELSDEDAVARYRAFLNPTSPTPTAQALIAPAQALIALPSNRMALSPPG